MKLVMFTQNNCTPCMIMENIIGNEVNASLLDEIIDISDRRATDMDLIMMYGINNVPELILFDSFGIIVDRVNTFHDRESIKNIFLKRGLK